MVALFLFYSTFVTYIRVLCSNEDDILSALLSAIHPSAG